MSLRRPAGLLHSLGRVAFSRWLVLLLALGIGRWPMIGGYGWGPPRVLGGVLFMFCLGIALVLSRYFEGLLHFFLAMSELFRTFAADLLTT